MIWILALLLKTKIHLSFYTLVFAWILQIKHCVLMVSFGGDRRWILLALDRVKKAVVGFV